MRSLQAKMFLVFALLATLPLMAMSDLAITQTRAAVAADAGSAREAAAQGAAGYAALYVQEGRERVEAAAEGSAMRNALAANDRASAALALSALMDPGPAGDAGPFANAYVLNATGRVVAAWPAASASVGEDHAGGTDFIVTAFRNAPVILAMPPTGPPLLPLASPVTVQGGFAGVLVARLRLATLGDKLQAFAPPGGPSLFLVDSQGALIADPNATLAAQRPDWSGVPPVARALGPDGGDPWAEFTDPATGTASLGATAPVRDTGWIVVASVPLSVAYAGLHRLTAVLIVFSGLLAGTILVASVVMARRIVRPVGELTEAARAFSSGQLATRTTPKGQDEIGELGHAFNDMADRVSQSVESLRASEARYRSLVESANDLIFAVDPEGAIGFVSPRCRPLLGRAPEDLVGRSVFTLVVAEDREALARAIAGVAATGAPAPDVGFRVAGPEGAELALVANLSLVGAGAPGPRRVLGVAHDVTSERREALVRAKSFAMARLVAEERALPRLAAQGLALATSSVSAGAGAMLVGTPDADSRVAASEGSMEGALGPMRSLAREAMVSSAPLGRDFPGGYLLVIPLREQGEAIGALALVGDARRLDQPAARALLVALGAQLAVGIRRSLFEERLREHAAQLEARVAERTAALTEKTQEIESFLYSVSHDLKAPLISIQGYAQSLEEDYAAALAGEGAQWLDRIRWNASTMEGLILDILELSRIGRVREEMSEVDMDALLARLALDLGDRLAEAGATLRVAKGLPRIRAEPKRVAQLFTNLLDNAIKYRAPGRALLIEVSATRTDGLARFDVRDNGRGIAARDREAVFGLFHRAPVPGMADPGGSGVGLAIVKRIAETHGGSIALESVEGEGTVFHVALPVEGARRIEVMEGAAQAAPRS